MAEGLTLIDEGCFDAHRAAGSHPERPERLDAARAGLARGCGEVRPLRIDAPMATEAELLEVHSASHLARLERALDGSAGHLDADTFFSPGTREAAWRSAGGAASLARALIGGEARRGVALLRPPGHHAEPDRAMGFCMLNNVAIAAMAARRAGAARVAIVDWDVHHGNGTQAAFEADPDVLFVSTHQWPLFPGTGAPGEVGRSAGLGTTCNLALPPGSGRSDYGEAFRRVVLPLVRAFDPQLVLVSAGFDAHASDPLASMTLDADTFGAMTAALVALVESLGHGRLGLLLEGGYDLAALGESTEASTRALLGRSKPALSTGPVSPAAEAAIVATERALAPHWPALFPARE